MEAPGRPKVEAAAEVMVVLVGAVVLLLSSDWISVKAEEAKRFVGRKDMSQGRHPEAAVRYEVLGARCWVKPRVGYAMMIQN